MLRAAVLALALVAIPAAAEDPTLAQIAQIVERDFYSANVLRKRDWPGLLARARTELGPGQSGQDRATVFQRLLAGLDTSHTNYFARSDPRHADLAAIFQRVLEATPDRCPAAVRPAFPIRVDGIGVWWRHDRDAWFVGGLLDGGAAHAAGVKLGDEIVTADGKPFSPVASFAGKSGRELQLYYRRERGGKLATLQLVPRSEEPLAAYAGATRASARIVERSGRRIGYVRLWSGVGDAPAEARAAIRSFNEQGMDAFVLDLRDGWGGVPPDFVSIFDRHVPVLISKTRGGDTTRFDGQVRVPSVVLVNEGVRSGKEVLALAIKKHRLATLIGSATPGALLAGTAYCLADGALLYLAVGTTTIDGELREGRGIAPDVEVPFDVRWAAGVDAQLEVALEHLAGTR